MITLVQFPSYFDIANPSPFCMKVEILLKMAGLDYAIEVQSDPSKGPKGKLPCIRDGATVIGDSALIQTYLESRYAVDFNAGLSAAERAISHAFMRMCEERLYWCMVYSRWIDDTNWPVLRQQFFGALPPIVRSIVPMIAQKQLRRNLQGQGLGRHSAPEIYAFGEADIDTLAVQLGAKPFMMGDAPTGLDSIAYPQLANLLLPQLPSPMTKAVHAQPTLLNYVERCAALWYGPA
ncbi:glutathione S-transferase family protein [Sphingorhabdus sp.]|uniref:glutathione S-transferase family protein n=1 Tax=Sphingorhabdus sp. TaxID=1902408 RepID=UPI0032B7B420